ncbi:hypothetical protein EDB80DRAFT_843224 [Ilyonectria destructans]|nr:hypothetical protein EDB80DRAFT_843224 [Ilyonectria destructans]
MFRPPGHGRLIPIPNIIHDTWALLEPHRASSVLYLLLLFFGKAQLCVKVVVFVCLIVGGESGYLLGLLGTKFLPISYAGAASSFSKSSRLLPLFLLSIILTNPIPYHLSLREAIMTPPRRSQHLRTATPKQWPSSRAAGPALRPPARRNASAVGHSPARDAWAVWAMADGTPTVTVVAIMIVLGIGHLVVVFFFMTPPNTAPNSAPNTATNTTANAPRLLDRLAPVNWSTEALQIQLGLANFARISWFGDTTTEPFMWHGQPGMRPPDGTDFDDFDRGFSDGYNSSNWDSASLRNDSLLMRYHP